MDFFNVTFWRRLTNFWGVVFMFFIIWDFFSHNMFDHSQLLLPIAVIHDAVLAMYSAEKEFRRWDGKHKKFHPGEIYVVVWTALVFTLVVSSLIFDTGYHVPAEVTASYLVVIGILAITKESKHLYREKHEIHFVQEVHQGKA